MTSAIPRVVRDGQRIGARAAAQARRYAQRCRRARARLVVAASVRRMHCAVRGGAQRVHREFWFCNGFGVQKRVLRPDFHAAAKSPALTSRSNRALISIANARR